MKSKSKIGWEGREIRQTKNKQTSKPRQSNFLSICFRTLDSLIIKREKPFHYGPCLRLQLHSKKKLVCSPRLSYLPIMIYISLISVSNILFGNKIFNFLIKFCTSFSCSLHKYNVIRLTLLFIVNS